MKVVFFLVFVWSCIWANSMVHFEKGWQLVGVPTTLHNMKDFNNSHVKLIWGFNATEQKWEGYSPDAAISKKLSAHDTLASLEPYQAIWIFSYDAWSLEIADTTALDTPVNNSIVLKKGWNLLTIPNKSIVYKDFFGDALVWKYDEKWSVNDSSLDFPTITNIKESEGFWVKSKRDEVIEMGEQLSKLRTFTSKEEMLSYLREMRKSGDYRNRDMYYWGDIAMLPPVVNDTTTDATANEEKENIDATTTNLQESGVDESDVLKHDGKYIFSIDNARQKIFITSFENITQKKYAPVNTISTTEQGSIIAMHLQNNRLILLSNNESYFFSSQPQSENNATVKTDAVAPYETAWNAKITIYDTSNINDIKKLSTHAINGTYEESRLIDNKLYFITRYYPQVQYEYPKIYVDTLCSTLNIQEIYSSCAATSLLIGSQTSANEIIQDCDYGDTYTLWKDNQCYNYNYDSDGKAWKYDYENPILISENLTPKIVSDANISELIKPSKLYAPQKLDQNSGITTISTFDIASAQYEQSISFLGDTHTYYASLTSLYLVSNQYPLYYNFYNYKERQMIYKFALDENLSYKGRGFVDGTMLNQFSMSEKDEYLRVATTQGDSWSQTGTNNSIYTLKENNEILEIKGSLSGLGKSGERIMGVRFSGDRGFVVTFRQTDPLYTLDLSDPLQPKTIGELSIPGFSRYLHVIDANRVLSVGRDADENTGQTLGLQLQLFNITDFANPILADKIQVGNDLTFSAAEYNHKAFVYRPSDLMFGLPFTDYVYANGLDGFHMPTNSTENFGIYQVDGMSIKEIHTISKTLDDNYWGNEKRGLIFDLNNTTYGALFEGSDVLSDTIVNGK